MMKRTFALCMLTIRAHLRSRIFAVQAIAVWLTVWLTARGLTGDGSPEGDAEIRILYTLGFVMALLSAITAWITCNSISQEIQERRIQLLVVTPIRTFEIWAGKWLALVLLNTFFLASSGAILLGVLTWNTRPAWMKEPDRLRVQSQVLTARTAIPSLSPDSTPDALTVQPGESRCWRFALPENLDRAQRLSLRFGLYAGTPTSRSVQGVWSLDGDGPQAPRQFAEQAFTPRIHTLQIPESAAQPGRTLTVRFTNTDPRKGVATFDPVMGIVLLSETGSFAGNLARAIAILAARLALIAAVGTTAGALFTFPVASFLTLSLLIITLLCGELPSAAQSPAADEPRDPAAPSGILAFSQSATRIAEKTTALTLSPPVLRPLSEGLAIPLRPALRAIGLTAFLLPAALGAAAAWILRKRQLALPET